MSVEAGQKAHGGSLYFATKIFHNKKSENKNRKIRRNYQRRQRKSDSEAGTKPGT